MATQSVRPLFTPCSRRVRSGLCRRTPCSPTLASTPLAQTRRLRTMAPGSIVRPNRIYNFHNRQTRSINSTATRRSRSDSKFKYNVAASYIAKGRTYNPHTHVFHFKPCVQAPERKGKAGRPESGQDAFFVSSVGDSASAVALGVADGVGGWMDSGVDPADFSHALCESMAAAARATGSEATKPTARQLMQEGYLAVCREAVVTAGGSTAVVGLLGEDGTLEVANLGDSGFIHLRLNAVHAASEPQTHAFNTPFQLSVVPASMLQRTAAFGGPQLMDHPRDAEVTRHALRHGDVLVFASDGLWDNLFNQDILRIVSQAMTQTGAWSSTNGGVQVTADLARVTQPEPSPTPANEPTAGTEAEAAKTRAKSQATLQSLLATLIVRAAKAASVNAKLDGPFAKEVKKFYPNERWQGGKEDDICVVAVVVSEEEAPPKAHL